jgi:hypothetical protein
VLWFSTAVGIDIPNSVRQGNENPTLTVMAATFRHTKLQWLEQTWHQFAEKHGIQCLALFYSYKILSQKVVASLEKLHNTTQQYHITN